MAIDSRRSGRRHPRRQRSRVLRAALGLGSIGLLAVAGIALAVSLAATLHSAPVTSAAPSSADATVSSGDWIPLRSQAPSDVLAAMQQSPMLDPANGQTLDLSRLGTPLLVHGLAARDGSALPDTYVVPALDRSGHAAGAVEAELNASGTALQVDGIVTFAKAQPAAITRLSATAAAERVSQRRHVALRAGEAPQLVYFPVDSEAQTLGKLKWSAGGEYPADPIWRVPGADGQDYFVGTNGAVYTLAQLPRAASTAG